MNFKNIVLVSLIGMITVGFIASCDGGEGDSGLSRSSSLAGGGSVGEGLEVGNSGADTSLEDGYADDIFAAINAERTGTGRAALIRDVAMDILAAEHNATMISASSGTFGAIVTGHANSVSRQNAVFSRGFTGFGENTGGIRGYSSSSVPSVFVSGWVNSPGHYDNIIGDFTHSGIAVTVDIRDGTIYSTQIFGRLP